MRLRRQRRPRNVGAGFPLRSLGAIGGPVVARPLDVFFALHRLPVYQATVKSPRQGPRRDAAPGISIRALLGLVALATLACGGDTPLRPAPAASGLVFARVVDGTTRIHRGRISDGAVQALTSVPGREERWPYWSQRARRIVFQVGDADEAVHSDLVLFDPATATETALTTTPNRTERWPGWSPDGRTLVYAFVGGKPASGIAIVNWRRGRVRIAARGALDDLFLRPNFSSDGKRLVAQRRLAGTKRGSNLWLVEPRSAPRRLTFDPAWVDSKAWFTRDGVRVIYTRQPAGGGRYDIFGVETAGGAPFAVVASEADDHSARPSPTRDEIAFVSNRNGSADIFLAGLDGSDVRTLAHHADTNDFAPRWSPDGELLVVTRVDREVADFGSMSRSAYPNARIVVFDREGRELFETHGLMPDWMPAWP